MQLDKGLFVEIKTNGKELVIPADWLSFSINDSIHSIYNSFDSSILDRSGKISEVLLTTPGNIFSIKFGKEDDMENIVEGSFVINDDKMASPDEGSKVYGGKVDLFGYHEWFNLQQESSASFKTKASSVANTLTNSYPWKGKNITSTQETKAWFQGLRTPARFIQEIVTPKSFSNSLTPFFAFINNKNEFNFLDYSTMFTGSAKNFYYSPGASENLDPSTLIHGISRWSESLKKAKMTKKKMSYRITDSGELEKLELNSNDFYKKPPSDIYLVSNQEGRGPTNHITTVYGRAGESISDMSYNEVNEMRESFFRERFIILLSFDPSLVAGKTINIYLYLPTDTNDSYSVRFSGKYLVEASSHIWSGETKSAMTKLVISRKYNSSIPDDFQLKRIFK